MAPKAFYYFRLDLKSAEGKNLHWWLRMNLCASGVANSPLSFTFENANTSRPNISTSSARYTPYMKITSFKKFFINFCQADWARAPKAHPSLFLTHAAHCLLLFPRYSKAASGRLLSFNETFLNKSTLVAQPKYFLCLKGDEIFAKPSSDFKSNPNW